MAKQFNPEGLTFEVIPEGTPVEKIFEGVEYRPGDISDDMKIPVDRMDALRVKMDRFRITVDQLKRGLITPAIYHNERTLAALACDYGDEILALTPDQALDESIQLSRAGFGRSPTSEQWLKLAIALEERLTYKQRVF